MRKFFTLFCILGFTLGVKAQHTYWEGGLTVGGAAMSGDLVDHQFGSMNDVNFAFGLMARRYFSPNWAFRASLIHSGLKASDERSYRLMERGFRTKTPLTELSVDLAFDLLGHRRGKTGLISPYVFVGAGLALINPDTYFNAANGEASADKNADVSGPQFVVPMGVGLRLDMDPNLSVALELAPRATFTDYLDGVSQAANPEKGDWYGLGTVQLTYRLSVADRDGDGIADVDDACPEVAGTKLTSGCPDRDGDGIADAEDACPDIPGLAAMSGCADSDEDGITDAEDACPTQAGPAVTGGCPDGDGDGIVDELDDCPLEPGTADNNGCPVRDADGDGVPDDEDACPNEPGTVEHQGCPVRDTDLDGVPDPEDGCPEIAGPVAKNGCPSVVVRFSNDEGRFLSDAYDSLDQLARILLENPEYRLMIEGYTDSRGNSTYNLKLSITRAISCYEYLQEKGVPAKRMRYQGFGENDPIASNETEAGRILNRRVELSLYK